MKLPIYTVTKKQECETRKFFKSNKSWTIFPDSCRIEDSEGNILAIFLKQRLSEELIDIGQDLARYKSKTSLRINASGDKNVKRSPRSGSLMETGNRVQSAMVGYAAASNFHDCRATAMFKKEYDVFQEYTKYLIEEISNLYEQFCPEMYNKQESFVGSLPKNMRLGNSVFTTLTVNVDFRTAAHRDEGDFKEGFGNLCVFQDQDSDKKFKGGEFLMPEYKIGFKIEEGDLLLVDVHQIHCNNPIQNTGRISLVCYAMQKIARCPSKVTKKQLFYEKPKVRKSPI